MSVRYRSAAVAGVNVAYREAGNPASPALLLLHGFPASSFIYRHLTRALADRFHLVAPDYPGFGNSEAPDPDAWRYTFDHLAECGATANRHSQTCRAQRRSPGASRRWASRARWSATDRP